MTTAVSDLQSLLGSLKDSPFFGALLDGSADFCVPRGLGFGLFESLSDRAPGGADADLDAVEHWRTRAQRAPRTQVNGANSNPPIGITALTLAHPTRRRLLGH